MWHSFKVLFNMLSTFGVWRPLTYTTKSKRTLYQIYSCTWLPLPVLLEVGLLSRIILIDLTLIELTEMLFLILTTTNVICKALNFLLRRKYVIELLELFEADIVQPRNDEELEIQQRYDRIISLATWTMSALVQATVLLWISVPFFQEKDHRTLPFKIWLPYDYVPDKVFWFLFAADSMAIIVIAVIATANEASVSGFFIAACQQFDLLTYRFANVSKYLQKQQMDLNLTASEIEIYEQKLMIENIKYHIYIFKIADYISIAFNRIILAQFLMSSVIISVNIYQLSTVASINAEFFSKLLYLLCMLVEFFVYCWFGNELTVKSEEFGDDVLQMDWIDLNQKSQKLLLFVALRATKPIVISPGYLIVLSLKSFTSVIKTSYTAFNVLRTSSE